ncbi:hypothetical protein [Rhodococcus sp. IEGM 1408]|uniref:hypothetical protein n=1 Tax=Rhodococcus sp. IEGM 1408 TaxID=3082220 RepID=UPI002955249F|nr:hypothetical protein [Rhodococcus sp. IEGM 1408]MDV8000211.1 hypothetical protein [Rhodococcus sp. IEGM 1408]
MTTIRRSIGLACATGLVAGGAVVAGAPMASAQVWHDSPAWDVRLPYPLGGEHTIRFGAFTTCKLGGDGEFHQALSAHARDLDQPIGSFDFSAALFPFNSATVKWHNTDTNVRGAQTVQSTGPEVGIGGAFTGHGRLAVTITTSKSALPTLAPGSVAPLASVTHTERFLVPAGSC